MHPPFRPRLAARSNPTDGTFESGDPSLAELSAFLDANFDILAERRTAVQMLITRGKSKASAFRAVDNDIALAWFTAKKKGADAKNAILSGIKKDRAQETRKASRETSLTVTTEGGGATEAGVEDTAESGAESRLSEKDRERKLVEVLDSYGLTLELYTALSESSVTQEGRVAKRTDDAALAQQTGRSVKDIATLRRVAFMLSLHRRGDALLSADELEDQVSRVM